MRTSPCAFDWQPARVRAVPASCGVVHAGPGRLIARSAGPTSGVVGVSTRVISQITVQDPMFWIVLVHLLRRWQPCPAIFPEVSRIVVPPSK